MSDWMAGSQHSWDTANCNQMMVTHYKKAERMLIWHVRRQTAFTPGSGSNSGLLLDFTAEAPLACFMPAHASQSVSVSHLTGPNIEDQYSDHNESVMNVQ